MKSVSAHERLWGDRRGWDERPLLRELYLNWFGMMASHLRPGRTVELGSGPGRFAEQCEGVIAADIVHLPWLDVVLDATRLPFGEGAVDNLVMLDVFHHLDVVAFLDEAGRVLSPGGRVVMIEPYISAFSYLIYHFVHDEPTRMKGDPFFVDPALSERPFDGNQALPTLVFWRFAERFRQRWPIFSIRFKELFSILLYPLSGGYRYPKLIPTSCIPVVRRIEKCLHPFRRWLAFRTLVVLERRNVVSNAAEVEGT
ncbi:MAG: methyltransferase domain-containing protein [Nitrospinota bacterium]|nr:methyltransferase domain-containing protein [Nitrospinota bacterium]